MRHLPVAIAMTLLLHCIPVFLLTLPRVVFPQINASFDLVLNTDAITINELAPQMSVVTNQTNVKATLNNPQKSSVTPTKELSSALATEAVPSVVISESVKKNEPKLTQPFLAPLLKPRAAFDESKTTQETPKEGYLSDRSSTAADRGPKNLKRGDPFIDKGESKIITALKKRGEDSLSVTATNSTSGSVKKEGNPDASDVQGSRFNVQDSRFKVQCSMFKAQGSRFKVQGSQETLNSSARPSAVTQADVSSASSSSSSSLSVQSSISNPKSSIVSALIIQSKSAEPIDELAAFKAALEKATKSFNADNKTDAKIDTRGRLGALGHEGDGSPLPGHATAVSNVTMINLNSSAAEFDEARFAKIFDPVIAYFKPLLRRIDGKWKAEIVARNRARILSGIVALKIVMRKDGVLQDVLEMSRFPKELSDDYVAIAKLAAQRAAEGKSEPFPPALEKFETLEISVGFVYH